MKHLVNMTRSQKIAVSKAGYDAREFLLQHASSDALTVVNKHTGETIVVEIPEKK